MEQKTLSAEPRRSFSNEFKLQMVKLTLQPGASVARIARKHDINDNLLEPPRVSWRVFYLRTQAARSLFPMEA
ncbi:TPA: transposase [Escherichia coli]|nr:transposase [Escherichia coli]HAX4916642.1 transposase [Escherichia coli]